MPDIPSFALIPPLRFDEFQKRLSSHVYLLYTSYSFLIKGGVFTVAALSLLHIFAGSADFRLGRFLLWLASFAFCLVTISTWNRGCAMTNAKAGILDVLLPIGIAIPEFLLFIVLDPTTEHNLPWNYWYLVLAFHALGGLMIISYRLAVTNITADFDGDLQSLARDYLGWMKSDRRGAAIGIIMNSIVFVATLACGWLTSPPAYYIHYALALFLIGLGIRISYLAFQQYDQMARYVPGRA